MTDKDKECRSQREAFDAWIFQRGVSGEKLAVAEEAFQAGAAWQQSRLLDEGLVGKVAREIVRTSMDLAVEPMPDHIAYALGQAAIAEIKKHMEGV